MERRGPKQEGGGWLTAAIVVFGIAAVALFVIAVGGGDLSDAFDDILPFVFALAALLAFAGWSRDRKARALRAVAAERDAEWARTRLQERDREVEQLQQRSQERGERLGELERRTKEQEERLEEERTLRQRTQRARLAEREWAQELREQVMRMHKQQGALGGGGSLPDLVLETAVRLVEAQKGLLLSRKDEDDDGKLDLVAHVGFESDPSHSEIAQRFAGKVIAKDEIVREDRDAKLNGDADADDEINCLIAIPIYIQDGFEGIIVAANREGGFEECEDDVLLALGNHAGAVLENRRLHGELRGSYLSTVRMLADTIEAKDPDVRVHSDEVASYVAHVADELTMESDRREQLIFASLLHDIGKIGISERILLKPGRLSDEERSVVELHPLIGCRLVEQVPALRGMTTAVLHHHERFDGEGYPSGLKGEDIPLEARIVCVADCFSAMTSDRPYRRGMTVEEACVELERCAGTQFDPRIVKLFVDEVRRRPAHRDGKTALSEAFGDPQVQVRRNGSEPVLGYGTTEVTDNLTLLYSHRYLHEVADAEAERASIQDEPFSVVMVCVDDLEEINLRDGFAAGDRALQDVARALQDAAVSCKGIASRYSGRRFALVVPRAGEQAAQACISELLGEMESLGRRVRTSLAVWEEGDSGTAVVGRARLGLDLRAAVEPA